jgi:hypothetical protein
MDNLENYLYLIFAVIYIISRIIKAKAKQKEANMPTQSQQGQAQTTQNQTPPKKAFSFEDILKEFEKNLGGEELSEEKPEPVIERRHEPIKAKPVPKVERKPSVYESYEGLTYESQMTAGQEESGTSLFARNEKFELNQNITSDYIKMLQDPEGVRNAIVISEIINRKYF